MVRPRLNRRALLARGAGAALAAAAANGWPTSERSARAARQTPALPGGMTLTVLLGEPIGTIRPALYGQFTEHIGGVIYDGIWVGPDSKIPNLDGIRRELVEHVRRLGPIAIRWPGGCFADGYHWRDG